MQSMIRQYGLQVFAGILLVLGAIGIFFLNRAIRDQELVRRQSRLEAINQEAQVELKAGIDNFVLLVSGFREYIERSEEMPPTGQLQSFINQQLDAAGREDLLVVSFIDTNYVFRSSFTRSLNDPGGLVGTSVPTIRDSLEMQRLDTMMLSDDLRLLNPFNLVEGWAGLPLNFRVKRGNKVTGFMAPIIDTKTILDRVYSKGLDNDFVFRFHTSNGVDFDRFQVYDQTAVYHQRKDPEYYQNFNIDPAGFVYSDLESHGIKLTIGTAYKRPYTRNILLTVLLYGAHIFASIFTIIMVRQTIRYNKINRQLKQNNELINRQKEQLEELNAAKDKFFKIIAHDMKGPLHSILGLVGLLNQDQNDAPTTSKMLKYLDETSQKTLKLLENLLEWASFQTGNLVISYQLFDLMGLIKEAVSLLKPLAEQKEIKLTIIGPEKLFIKADKNILGTVTRNLISNAIKYTPVNGEVSIQIEDKTKELTVAVHDNGVGISDEDLERLFKVGKNVSKPGTKGETGTGLGLVLCKDFIEAHKGSIWVESVPGKGSTFYFSIPK